MKKITLLAAAAVALSASAQHNVTNPSTTAALAGIEKATIDVVLMDEDTRAVLTDDPNYTVNYIGPDEENIFMYIWENTYEAGTAIGPNADGGAGYFSLVNGNVGWTGGGWFVAEAAPALNLNLTDETIFHLAYKSTSSTVPPVMMSLFPDAGGCKFNLGKTIETEPDYATSWGVAPTEEWQAIQLTVGEMKKAYGWNAKTTDFHGNYMVLLTGPTPGQDIALDAVYFITPTEGAGINDITVDNTNAPVEYFNLQGVRVANPENGVFVRRQGTEVSKVIL